MAGDDEIYKSRIGQVGIFQGGSAVIAERIENLNQHKHTHEAPKDDPRLIAIRVSVDRFLQQLSQSSEMLIRVDGHGGLNEDIPAEQIWRWERGVNAYFLSKDLDSALNAIFTLRVDATSLLAELATVENEYGRTLDAGAAHLRLEPFFSKEEVVVMQNPMKAGHVELSLLTTFAFAIFSLVFVIATFAIGVIVIGIGVAFWQLSRAQKTEAAKAANQRTINAVREKMIRELQSASRQIADAIFHL